MLKFSLLGAGRIGKLHAKNIVDSDDAELAYVFDVNKDAAKELTEDFGGRVATTSDEAIDNEQIDAVLIASSTDTHVDLIIKSTQAEKHVLCEKPIDLSIEKVNECRKKISGHKNIIQIGFNRRFDASHAAAQQTLKKGEIGSLEKIIITSRDPAPPWADYLKVSGGIFKDMGIHDFDLARFVLDQDPITEVYATGSALFDKNAQNLNDFDTAMVIMKSHSGVLVHINNSRRAVYGYDQRLEIFGSLGMVISDNQTPTSIKKFSSSQTNVQDPIQNFFLERYIQAYKDEIYAFIDSIKNNKKSNVDFEDGETR